MAVRSPRESLQSTPARQGQNPTLFSPDEKKARPRTTVSSPFADNTSIFPPIIPTLTPLDFAKALHHIKLTCPRPDGN